MYSSRERDACALCLRASVPKFRTGIQSCGALWSVALVPVCGHVLVQHPRCFQLFHFISLIWLLRFLCTRQRRVRVHQTAYERFLCDFAVGRAACSPLAPRRRRRCITPSAGRSHGRNPPESTRTHAWLAHYSVSRHVCTHAHTTGAGAPLSAARRPVVRLGVAATPRHAAPRPPHPAPRQRCESWIAMDGSTTTTRSPSEKRSLAASTSSSTERSPSTSAPVGST